MRAARGPGLVARRRSCSWPLANPSLCSAEPRACLDRTCGIPARSRHAAHLDHEVGPGPRGDRHELLSLLLQVARGALEARRGQPAHSDFFGEHPQVLESASLREDRHGRILGLNGGRVDRRALYQHHLQAAGRATSRRFAIAVAGSSAGGGRPRRASRSAASGIEMQTVPAQSPAARDAHQQHRVRRDGNQQAVARHVGRWRLGFRVCLDCRGGYAAGRVLEADMAAVAGCRITRQHRWQAAAIDADAIALIVLAIA